MAIRKVYSKQESFRNGFAKQKDRKEFSKWPDLDKQGQFKLIDKREIYVDDSYQRTPSKADKIAAEFSWRSFGVVSVVRRASKYFAFDGQHRVEAACMRSDIEKVPCLVFQSEGVEQEAKDYITIQSNRRKVSALEQFKARLVAKDPVALDIKRIAEDCGFEIKPTCNGKHNALGAVTYAERAYLCAGPDMLEFALLICSEWYKGIAPGQLVYALALMERKLVTLGESLSKYQNKIGVLEIVDREIKGLAARTGSNITYSIHEAAILGLINKGRRTRKIELSPSEAA